MLTMTETAWLYPAQAARLVGVSRDVIYRWMTDARVRVRRLPGARPQVFQADLLRIVAEAERPREAS